MAANPNSESELQLYRVLQRSNLLQYFETFISQGGDDVQQLCEAGEEEFLEIMALVGMASKPLHVRRLQKALQEWVTNPMFHQPIGPHTPLPPVAPGSILASVQRPYLNRSSQGSSAPWAEEDTTSAGPLSLSPASDGVYGDTGTPNTPANYNVNSPDSGGANTSYMGEDRSTTSPGPPSQLSEAQIAAIARSAEELAKTLPLYEAKFLNPKKLINKEIEEVMKLPTDHPERSDLLRKYACIYGRFDSRRKNEKQLSLHEISVNEASAQLCKHQPTLLTRRDDLFPLARQVVRDSGYQYSKGHSRSHSNDIPPNKKQCLESFAFTKQDPGVARSRTGQGHHRQTTKQKEGGGGDTKRRKLRLAEINQELSRGSAQQAVLKQQLTSASGVPDTASRLQTELQGLVTRQLQLLTEQSDLLQQQRIAKRSRNQHSRLSAPKDDSDEEEEVAEDGAASRVFLSELVEVKQERTSPERRSQGDGEGGAEGTLWVSASQDSPARGNDKS